MTLISLMDLNKQLDYLIVILQLMGTSKKEIFTTEQNQLADYARALAHPARVAILQHLVKTNQCICGDLVGELGLAQATVSQHLKELKKAGIIKGNITGTSVCYCIDSTIWNTLNTKFSTFFSTYTNCEC